MAVKKLDKKLQAPLRFTLDEVYHVTTTTERFLCQLLLVDDDFLTFKPHPMVAGSSTVTDLRSGVKEKLEGEFMVAKHQICRASLWSPTP